MESVRELWLTKLTTATNGETSRVKLTVTRMVWNAAQLNGPQPPKIIQALLTLPSGGGFTFTLHVQGLPFFQCFV